MTYWQAAWEKKSQWWCERMLRQRQALEKLQNRQREMECVTEKWNALFLLTYIFLNHSIVSFLHGTVGSEVPNTTLSQIFIRKSQLIFSCPLSLENHSCYRKRRNKWRKHLKFWILAIHTNPFWAFGAVILMLSLTADFIADLM